VAAGAAAGVSLSPWWPATPPPRRCTVRMSTAPRWTKK
jgi:hypothetical protein